MKSLELKRRLRNLSGADVKVLIAIGAIGGFDIGVKLIKEWTKLSRPTITDSLQSLQIEGLITNTKRTNGWQLTRFGFEFIAPSNELREKVLTSPHSSSILIDSKDINIKDSTTTIEKVFTSHPKIVSYLQEKGVWDNQIDAIAKFAGSNLGTLKSYFDHLDLELAIYRIKKEIPPDEPKTKTDYLNGEWSDHIE